MEKFSSKVMIDANIILKFKDNLELLFRNFDSINIHEEVFKNELLSETLKNNITRLSESLGNIIIVKDNYENLDEHEKLLFNECDKELKLSFDIENNKDRGEYKTLLYSKFNKISLFASQDTTVWVFLKESKYFKGIECITIQDICYLLYLNSDNSYDKRQARGIYRQVTRSEHKFKWFKEYMQRIDNKLPGYFEFEYSRINNFKELFKGYKEFYYNEYTDRQIKENLVTIATNNQENCLSCLVSRVNKDDVNLEKRICFKNLLYGEETCLNTKELFDEIINIRRGKDKD